MEITREDLVKFIIEVENRLNFSLKKDVILSLYNICFGDVEPKTECMRSFFAELESSNVKFLSDKQITADQACANCKNKHCESSEMPFTAHEMLSGKSGFQLREDRKRRFSEKHRNGKSRLEKVWLERRKEAMRHNYG